MACRRDTVGAPLERLWPVAGRINHGRSLTERLVRQHDNRSLQKLRDINRVFADLDAVGNRRRCQHNARRVPMRAVNRKVNVALLGLRRDAGGWPGTHDVDQHKRDFGGGGEPQAFNHQREARARSNCHRRCAAVRRAQRQIDGRQFILAENKPAAELEHMRRQPFHEIRRRRDWIAANKSNSAAQRAERNSLVTADQPTRRGFRRIETSFDR